MSVNSGFCISARRGVPGPHSDRAVVARRGQTPAIRTELNGPDQIVVAADLADRKAGPGIPHLHGVARPFVEEIPPIGVERHAEREAFLADRLAIIPVVQEPAQLPVDDAEIPVF